MSYVAVHTHKKKLINLFGLLKFHQIYRPINYALAFLQFKKLRNLIILSFYFQRNPQGWLSHVVNNVAKN